jgi:DNA mismatch repair protein MSH4
MLRRSLSRPSTSYTSRSPTANSSLRPHTARTRTGISTLNDQEIVCAVIESRGVSPIVGIAFLNLTAAEATLCQISDSQTYVRTIQKILVYEPYLILVPAYGHCVSSKLYGFIEENVAQVSSVKEIDRRYFSETAGSDYIEHLAFMEDVEVLKLSMKGYFFALCCFSAVRNA